MSTISSYANSSVASMLQDLQQKFKTSDTSGNGTLSQTEFTAAAQGLNDTLKTADISTAFKKMDADGNGELTEAELTEGVDLADQVQQALLMAQEIMSGSLLMNMLGGSSSGSSTSLSSLLSGSTDATSGTSSGYDISSLMEALTATYQATEDAAATPETPTTTTSA